MSDGPLRTCVRCVMDGSDPEIAFSADGVCSHCLRFERRQRPAWMPDERGAARLRAWVERARARGRGRPYDAVLGLSGGVDSAWLALRLAGSGLRILAVHVDCGWNSAIAVGNIERLLRHCCMDLATHVVYWPEMRDLQLAFLRAGVPNQDIPQDHAIFAALRAEARRFGVRCLVSAHNLASESVLPSAWGYNAMDLRHLRAIHARFGVRPLHRFPTIGLFRLKIADPRLHRLEAVRPLDWMPYDRARAKAELAAALGWQDYGGKHGESRFTRFFQGWWLPTRFGWDKRRAHLSSLILAGQATREQALAELARPPWDPAGLERDLRFIARKLGCGTDEFRALCAGPVRRHADFPSHAWITALAGRVRGALGGRCA